MNTIIVLTVGTELPGITYTVFPLTKASILLDLASRYQVYFFKDQTGICIVLVLEIFARNFVETGSNQTQFSLI